MDHFNVRSSPTAVWTAQQMIEAFPADCIIDSSGRPLDEVVGNAGSSSFGEPHVSPVKLRPLDRAVEDSQFILARTMRCPSIFF
jgi:hypothetical protein